MEVALAQLPDVGEVEGWAATEDGVKLENEVSLPIGGQFRHRVYMSSLMAQVTGISLILERRSRP